jgi:AcrR family transcriptional regulator
MYVKLTPGMEARTRKAEQSEATRAALIAASRELFAERGYADVGTEEIVRRARVTRGALYHHFQDKKDLFRAAHEASEAELTQRIGEAIASSGATDPVEALVAGARLFLDHCTEPEARAALVDAPAVLGWTEWREIDERYGLGLVMGGLEGAMEAGALRRQPVKPLAHLLLGALGEAGMLIANAEDPEAVRREVEPALLSLLEGLRA